MHPSFVLLKAEVRLITRALAEQFRDMEPSPTERELNPSRINYLKTAAEAGLLVAFNWATAKMGGQTLRVNGQHSSIMLSGLPDPFPEGLQAHVDHYEVADSAGLASLFRQFDARKSGRSAGDVAGAYQMLVPELREIKRPIAKMGVEGIAWYRRTVQAAPIGSGDDQYRIFAESGYHAFLLWMNEAMSIKTPELKRSAIVAAMYATFSANDKEARKFWDQVARSGVEFEDNAASTVLDAWLTAAKEGTLKDELKDGQYYQGCIYAWNAFREEKAIKDIRADTKKSWYQPVE